MLQKVSLIFSSLIVFLPIATHLSKLVRQSQIVQSVMQDCQYDLSHLPPEFNLLVQGPKITYTELLFVKTVRVTVVIYVEFRSF